MVKSVLEKNANDKALDLRVLDESELRQVSGGEQTPPPPDPEGKRIGSFW
jgi:hypothetical protein